MMNTYEHLHYEVRMYCDMRWDRNFKGFHSSSPFAITFYSVVSLSCSALLRSEKERDQDTLRNIILKCNDNQFVQW